MCRIGIQPRMPHRADRQFRRRHGQVKPLKTPRRHLPVAKAGAWHERDQVRATCDVQGVREAWHDHDDLTPQAHFAKGVVHRTCRCAPTRCDDVPARGIKLRRHRMFKQRMAQACRTDEVVAEEKLTAHLGCGRARCADLQVDPAVAQRRHLLIGLGGEAKADMWRRLGNCRDQRCGKQRHEPFIGADRERPLQ